MSGADVRVRDGQFGVTVQNPVSDSRREPRRGSGLGLVGMRERVESIGGRLTVDHDSGRFQVRAEFQVPIFPHDNAVDVILMDIRMPGIDGVEATRRIRKDHPPQSMRIIVLTTFDQDQIVLSALRAGANGFLSKTVSPAELVAGITEVAGGGGALSAAATAVLIGHMTDSPPALPDKQLLRLFDALTPRERDVVVLVARGLSNTEIAAQLFVSRRPRRLTPCAR